MFHVILKGVRRFFEFEKTMAVGRGQGSDQGFVAVERGELFTGRNLPEGNGILFFDGIFRSAGSEDAAGRPAGSRDQMGSGDAAGVKTGTN